jgi:hypothetical protein
LNSVSVFLLPPTISVSLPYSSKLALSSLLPIASFLASWQHFYLGHAKMRLLLLFELLPKHRSFKMLFDLPPLVSYN